AVSARAALADREAARVERHRDTAFVAGETGGARRAACYAHREVRGGGRAAVIVDDVLDHDEVRRLVVVRDRTGLRLAIRDRPAAIGRGARAVSARAALADREAARVERHRRAALAAREAGGPRRIHGP